MAIVSSDFIYLISAVISEQGQNFFRVSPLKRNYQYIFGH